MNFASPRWVMSQLHGDVWVLRIGHRLVRDERITTHVGLVARAFGARGIFVVGLEEGVKRKLDDVTERWGGPFRVEVMDEWRPVMRKWKEKGIVVHLTMYGLHMDDVMGEIRGLGKELLIVVGGEKVPKEVFDLADYNVAIGNQPHSEVSALAVFLDRYFMRRQLRKSFHGARIAVEPRRGGKRLLILKEQ